mmetsp:Transcript_101125/g.292438  ORF Transcript_101125/g.292438 Transcript_101125/m.292438 type:complete len:261 (+) Transcript_101125:68-850(+)
MFACCIGDDRGAEVVEVTNVDRECPEVETLALSPLFATKVANGRPAEVNADTAGSILGSEDVATSRASATAATASGLKKRKDPLKKPKELKSFVAKVVRRDLDEPLGFRLDSFDNAYIYVAEVLPEDLTAIGRYNKSVPKDRQINVGQYILAVNGCTEKEAMIAELSTSRQLDIEIRQPRHFSATIPKNGLPLGLSVLYNTWGGCLYIKDVEPNSAARAALPDIAPGDRVVAVNGRCNGVMQMLEELRLHQTPEVTFSRP